MLIYQLYHSNARPKPSPSFNAETKQNVQPLANQTSDMDESYVLAYEP